MIDIDPIIAAREHELVALRRRLHAHPELSGQEFQTTEALVERLEVAGLEPHVLKRGTGLVCDIPGADDGPLVALRADIDALAMHEKTQAAYASRIPGVAHACGHDVHTSIVLGCALALRRLREEDSASFPGTVRIIFEPAEETMPGGALDVIEEGWLHGVRAIFGVHCDPKIEVGTVGLRVGPLTSASDLVEISLHGPGGHTARPHLTVDIVRALGIVASGVPEAFHAALEANGTSLLVFGSAHAGDAPNVIPDSGVLRGLVRTVDVHAWARSEKVLVEVLTEALKGTGAQWQLDYRQGVPPSINDPWAVGILEQIARDIVGVDGVRDTPQSMGADSFAWYAQHVPAAYARLGTHRPGSEHLDLHAATFDVDERAIGIGVRLLSKAALLALNSEAPSPD